MKYPSDYLPNHAIEEIAEGNFDESNDSEAFIEMNECSIVENQIVVPDENVNKLIVLVRELIKLDEKFDKITD